MGREVGASGSDDTHAACALQCWRRRGAAGEESAPDQVTWGGLPINLDFAFSREKLDTVYLQHLKRKRLAQPWRWLRDGAQPCVCEMTAGHQPLEPDAARSMSWFMSSR
jgi:hypothetical protein